MLKGVAALLLPGQPAVTRVPEAQDNQLSPGCLKPRTTSCRQGAWSPGQPAVARVPEAQDNQLSPGCLKPTTTSCRQGAWSPGQPAVARVPEAQDNQLSPGCLKPRKGLQPVKPPLSDQNYHHWVKNQVKSPPVQISTYMSSWQKLEKQASWQ